MAFFKKTASAAPSDTLLDEMKELTPDAMRSKVKEFTSDQLDRFVEDMNGAKAMPEIFQEEEMQDAIAKRMEEVDVSLETQDKWKALKEKVGAKTPVITEEAEESFLKTLKEKGGMSYYLGAAALSVLSWFGFKKAKALKGSLEGKGYLRTAVEGVAEHPIFTAFLAALGIGAGKMTLDYFAKNKQAKEYLTDNKDAIETEINAEAARTGEDAEKVALSVADKLKNILSKGADLGLEALATGISTVLGGKYDEETGVVTLPHSSLRPPVVIAWQAGKRRRSGFSSLVVESRLKGIVRQAGIVAKGGQEISGHKQKLATRALELMNSGVLRNAPVRESMELERILGTLEKDLNLAGTKPIKEAVDYNPADAEKRVKALADEMERQHKVESDDFNKTKKQVFDKMDDGEKRIAAGVGNADDIRRETMDSVKKQMADYNDGLKADKLALGQQMSDALTNLGQHAPLQQNGPKGATAKTLEWATKKAEAAGCNMRKLPGGKVVTALITGYSFMPLALQGAAALRSGEEGEAAKKALQNDMIEAGAGFIPVVGEAMDIRSAVMGTDLNGRELSTGQRVTAGVMGGLGAVSLALTPFTAGLSVVGFRMLRGGLAARKAVKVASNVKKGITVAGATEDSIKAIRAGEKNLKTLEKMSELTKLNQHARRAKNFVQNAQRTMQLHTYAMLGYEVATGIGAIYESGSDIVETGIDKANQAIDTASDFVTNAIPS